MDRHAVASGRCASFPRTWPSPKQQNRTGNLSAVARRVTPSPQKTIIFVAVKSKISYHCKQFVLSDAQSLCGRNEWPSVEIGCDPAVQHPLVCAECRRIVMLTVAEFPIATHYDLTLAHRPVCHLTLPLATLPFATLPATTAMHSPLYTFACSSMDQLQ